MGTPAVLRIENTRDHYGAVAIALHWIMAVLLVVLIAMGLYMVSIPDAGFDKLKINLIIYHKEIGILVLLLMLLRWAWRFVNGLPALVASLPDWQKLSARFVHLCFYALMLALLASVGALRALAWPYYVGLGGAAAMALYHWRLIRARTHEGCFKAFRHNNWVGAAVLAGIVASFAIA